MKDIYYNIPGFSDTDLSDASHCRADKLMRLVIFIQLCETVVIANINIKKQMLTLTLNMLKTLARLLKSVALFKYYISRHG